MMTIRQPVPAHHRARVDAGRAGTGLGPPGALAGDRRRTAWHWEKGIVMARWTLLGAGMMMLVVGALHLVAPQMMMREPNIALTTVNHFHIVRAAYGGAYLGMAALFLAGLFDAALRRASLVAVALLFSGFAFGRVVSIIVDGLPVTLYAAVLGFELLFAALAVVSLHRPA